jgi:hypothetical protein
MLERLTRIPWKKQIRFYGILVGVCMILSAGINLLMDQGRRSNEESGPLRRLKSELEEYRRVHGDKSKREDVVRIWKSYQGKLSPEEIGKLKREFRATLDPAEVKSLQKAYEDVEGKKP